MNTDFIIIILLLVFPLFLMILCYRKYINNYCNNDMKCLNKRLLDNLTNLNERLKNRKDELEHMQNKLYDEALKENKKENIVEGFFDGLTNFFSSTPNNGLPVSPGSLDKQNINVLEKKISDRMKRSSSFPPKDDDDDEKKDSDNNALLKSINNGMKLNNIELMKTKENNMNNKNNANNKNNVENMNKTNIENMNVSNLDKNFNLDSSLSSGVQTKENTPIPKPNNIEKKPVVVQPLKNVLSSCNFFNDKCPDDYQPLGNFSISGVGNNTILACGNVDNVKPAKAIAVIKSNSIHEINVLDPGIGFNKDKPPKVSIEGGKGNGATATAVVDDNGYLKLIKIINPGYNYTETPNVIIDAPFMNSSCHLCCKL